MLEDKEALVAAVDTFRSDAIVHLAAQAGVRYSLEHPEACVSANLVGTFNILEVARAAKLRIPIQTGRVFRFEAGQHSGMKPASIPI